MASSVFYKFKSQKDESRVTFDGTGISVFDLKKEIILANNLGKANDFDLAIFDSQSQQEYKDDSQVIPRSSSVIVKRLPSVRPGKGKAAMYVAGAAGSTGISSEHSSKQPVHVGGSMTWHKGPLSKRFNGKDDSHFASSTKSSTPASIKSAVTKEEEAAAMAAMFQAQSENWEETQEKMSHATRVYSNTRGNSFSRGGKPHTPHQQHHNQPERPLPASYVCYRCGQKGHWIQDCPTNNDREFDNRPRIKRTTGIPRSFLKAVDNPSTAKLTQGVMVTPEGGYVVAQPDSASWQKQVLRSKGLTAADVRERVPSDTSLACPIDNKLFRDAVNTPCCGTLYCEECIQTHLLERDFVCPNCSQKIGSLDKLIIDKPMRTKIADYIDRIIEESKREGADEDRSSTPNLVQSSAASALDQELYSDNQPGNDMDMSQMLVDSIPQLQAQISQISVMLQNPSLPPQVRQTTQFQHQQLQMQLQQAQAVAEFLAVASSVHQQQQQQEQQVQQMQNATVGGGFAGQGFRNNWNNGFVNQQVNNQDSPYQRLPVNNRRRHLKRDRPSDFLEVTGNEGDNKVPRYWE